MDSRESSTGSTKQAASAVERTSGIHERGGVRRNSSDERITIKAFLGLMGVSIAVDLVSFCDVQSDPGGHLLRGLDHVVLLVLDEIPRLSTVRALEESSLSGVFTAILRLLCIFYHRVRFTYERVGSFDTEDFATDGTKAQKLDLINQYLFLSFCDFCGHKDFTGP